MTDVEEGERRYGLEHAAELVLLEYGGAFLLGLDGLPYQDPRLRETLAGYPTAPARRCGRRARGMPMPPGRPNPPGRTRSN